MVCFSLHDLRPGTRGIPYYLAPSEYSEKILQDFIVSR